MLPARPERLAGQRDGGDGPDIEPVTDIDFFRFPAADEGVEPGIVTSGETFGAFNDTPQTQVFTRPRGRLGADKILALDAALTIALGLD